MTQYENNLVAKLLEELASFCAHNALVCREEATPADYWEEQYHIAQNLSIQFRQASELAKPERLDSRQ